MMPVAQSSPNVVPQATGVSPAQHQAQSGHAGAVIWLTGLPGSGKSSIARATQVALHRAGLRTVLLDGDNLRHGLCADLGFSIAERHENVRRTGEVAKLFVQTGVIVLVALVSPMRSSREAARQLLPAGYFLEIFCRCPLDICRQRDPKGHYVKADSGAIAEFTGVSSPYEEPLTPALILDTSGERIDESVSRLTQLIVAQAPAANPGRVVNSSRVIS